MVRASRTAGPYVLATCVDVEFVDVVDGEPVMRVADPAVVAALRARVRVDPHFVRASVSESSWLLHDVVGQRGLPTIAAQLLRAYAARAVRVEDHAAARSKLAASVDELLSPHFTSATEVRTRIDDFVNRLTGRPAFGPAEETASDGLVIAPEDLVGHTAEDGSWALALQGSGGRVFLEVRDKLLSVAIAHCVRWYAGIRDDTAWPP